MKRNQRENDKSKDKDDKSKKKKDNNPYKQREKINVGIFNSLFPDEMKFKTKKEEEDEEKELRKNKFIPYLPNKKFYSIFRMEKADPEMFELRKKYLQEILTKKEKKVVIEPPKFALKPIKKKPEKKVFKYMCPSSAGQVFLMADGETRRSRTKSLNSKKSTEY